MEFLEHFDQTSVWKWSCLLHMFWSEFQLEKYFLKNYAAIFFAYWKIWSSWGEKISSEFFKNSDDSGILQEFWSEYWWEILVAKYIRWFFSIIILSFIFASEFFKKSDDSGIRLCTAQILRKLSLLALRYIESAFRW